MSNFSESDINKAIKQTISSMLYKHPFYGYILSKMKWVEIKDDNNVFPLKTAATDGKNIYYNAKFFCGLDIHERVFLIAHEMMHCMLAHSQRYGHREEPQYWNMACDYAINDILIRSKTGKFIECGLYNKKYENMSSEEIYRILLKEKPPKKECLDNHITIKIKESSSDDGENKNGSGKNDIKIDKDGNIEISMTQEEFDEMKQDISDSIISAATHARMAGRMPAELDFLVTEFESPKIKWNSLLQTSIQSLFKSDYSWLVRNRRTIDRRFVLPTLHYDEDVDIAVSIDTSGSITEEQRRTFLSEIYGILQYYKSFKLKIWTFDTKCHGLQEYDYTNIETLIDYKMRGGGGTDISSNYKFMKENDIVPKQFICLTDGYNYSNNWGDEDWCPVVWVIHSNPKPDVPFGRFALYEDFE